MTKQEIQDFIERMEEVGDDWTEEQVLDVYGDTPFDEAVAIRLSQLETMSDILVKATLGQK